MKKITALLSGLALIAGSWTVPAIASGPSLIPSPPQIAAKGYVLMDAESGEIIVEQNIDEPMEPASLTKMMTSYMLSYELAKGSVSKTDKVVVSKNAWAQNFPGSSLMWIEVGKTVVLEDLHRGVIISSGNDASVAVAEHLAGSESAFAEIMNQQAQILGMTNTHFVNSHGLPHPDHYSSARDLATLARAIIYDFPDDYKIYSEREFSYNNIRQTNRNTLLWRDPTADGLKTGHTESAGYCLVASAKRSSMRLISVVLGTKSQGSRLQETQKLMSYGFRYFQTHKLYDEGAELSSAKVWSGEADEISLGVNGAVILTIPKNQQDNVKALMHIDDTITAPIEQGQELGKVEFKLGNKVLKSMPLVAQTSVSEAGLFKRLWHSLLLFIQGLF